MTPRSLLEPARLAGTPLLRGQSDARLVDLTRAGNARAFEAIVHRYRRPLMRYCQRLLGREQAEDTVQQAFIRAYEAIRRGDNELNLRPWLYRIAHNASVDALRRGAHAYEELDPRIDGVERPDQTIERREAFTAVIAAVDKLPERQRNAVVLRELEGRSYEEIAATLGVTGGAVRQLLNRARTTLRDGVTALTPAPLIARLGASAETESIAARVAEICAPAGASAVAVKLTAAVVVTSAVAGGVATSPVPDIIDRERGPDSAKAAPSDDGSAGESDGGGGDRAGDDLGGDDRGERGELREREDDGDGRKDDRRESDGEDRDDNRSHGDRDEDPEDGHSGPGHGGRDDEDNSGPGSGDERDHDNSGPGGGDEPDHDNSGPGSGDEEPDGDSSGPGGGGESGSGHSGSGGGEDLAVEEDNSGSGSSGGRSGSSGSGSGSSGSGSGHSGAASSGSG